MSIKVIEPGTALEQKTTYTHDEFGNRNSVSVTLDHDLDAATPPQTRTTTTVWGERDGTRVLDYGEWGAKATAVYDADTLYQRLLAELVEALRSRNDLRADQAGDRARKLLQFSVIPEAGHAGLYTESHMGTFVERIVKHLKVADVVP